MKRMRFDGALRSLSGRELADLIGCLGRDLDENGITGELLGLCLVDSLRRLREEGEEERKVESGKLRGGDDIEHRRRNIEHRREDNLE